MASSDWGVPESKKKKEEDTGLLGTVAKNAGGLLDFVNPAKVVPALVQGIGGGVAGTAKELSRLPTTLAASALTGNDTKRIEESPLSFLANTDAMKISGNQPIANQLHEGIKQIAPIVSTLTDPIAETGIRGGSLLASGVSQVTGNGATPEEMLQQRGLEDLSYEKAAREGRLGSLLAQDILTVAPAVRGGAGALGKAGLAPEAVSKIGAVTTAAEGAPLAPYSIPAKGIYNAFRKAEAGGTAFPKITEALGKANPIEGGAQFVGDVWRGTSHRNVALDELAKAEERFRPQVAPLEEQVKALPEGSPQRLIAQEQLQTLHDDMTKGALDSATQRIQEPVTDIEGQIPRGWQDADIEKAMKGLKPKETPNFAIKAIDEVTGKWKGGVLPLNPAWQMGNVVSNGITAMTHGGVRPDWYLANKGRIAAEIENATEGGGRVMGAGQAGQFAEDMSKARTAPGRAIQKGTQKMYDLNQKVDDISHVAVYLQELDKLKASGMKPAEAQVAAAAKSLQTMGDFQNMSWAEKNIIRRAIPFYAWSKHSAKMNLREAMNNPVRQSRLLAASNAIGPGSPPEGMDFLEGAVPFSKGKVLRLPGGGDQLGLGGIEASPLANPVATLGALNPLLQLPMVAAGFNPRAGRELTKGAGQSGLSAAAGYAVNQTPLTKMLGDLFERSPAGAGSNLVKGDVRNPIVAGGRTIKDTKQDLGPIPAPLLKFFTGMSVDQPDIKGSQARAKKKEKQETSSAKKYEKAIHKKPKK